MERRDVQDRMEPRDVQDRMERRDVQDRARLGVISFGLALGLTAALFVFIIGMAAGLMGWGWTVVEVLSSLFLGYMPTFAGSVTGAVWAFVDFFVAGVMVALLYNAFLRARR